MNRIPIAFAALFALLILLSGATFGCGGSGGGTSTSGTNGGDTTLTGRVVSIVTGGPLSTAPSVQTEDARVTASADGSFTLPAVAGAKTVLVDAGSFGVFSFSGTAVSGQSVDLGDLYVGPQRVTLTGTLRNASTGAAVSGGTVTFAGRRATSNSAGAFTLTDVAYASGSTAAFLGITGSARATGYLATTFTTQGQTPSGTTLALGDIPLSPESDPNPPGLPYTITGRVSPFADAPGTVVSLKSGSTEVRRATVGSDASYGFWIGPGTYTITFTKGTRVAGPYTVTLADTTSVVRRDATLP